VLSSLEEEAVCSYYSYYYSKQAYGTGTALNCSDYFDYVQYVQDYYYGTGTYVVGPFVPTANGMMEENTFIKGKYRGWAAYVDLSLSLGEMWEVSVGLRHTYDKKTFSTRVPKPASTLLGYYLPGYMTSGLTASNDWSDTTPRVIVRFRPHDDHMMFASYTKGYKSGGFGTFSIVDAVTGDPVFQWFGEGDQDPLGPEDGVVPGQFKPEDVNSYEIGYKGTWFNGAALANVTAFYYEYTDLQITVGTESGATLVENAGEVEAWGIEASFTAGLGDYVTAYLALGYLDSEANKLEDICDGEAVSGKENKPPEKRCEGSSLWWAPEFSGALVLDASYPIASGAITGSFELTWESDRGRGWEDLSELEIDAYEEMALRIGYESNNNWFVEAYVENLTDEFTWDGVNHLGGKEPDAFFGPRRPRTFGVRTGFAWD